jgi:hypothetical protein
MSKKSSLAERRVSVAACERESTPIAMSLTRSSCFGSSIAFYASDSCWSKESCTDIGALRVSASGRIRRCSDFARQHERGDLLKALKYCWIVRFDAARERALSSLLFCSLSSCATRASCAQCKCER